LGRFGDADVRSLAYASVYDNCGKLVCEDEWNAVMFLR